MIGAGVSGLTTAVCLAEAGIPVRVIAATAPGRTTSAVAGASWGPYLTSDERVLPWSMTTLAELGAIAAAQPGSGVHLASGIEAAPEPMEPPDWALSVPGFRRCTPAELPAGYLSGWEYTIPLVDMPVYLRYLETRLADAGVPIELRGIGSLGEVRDEADVLVNCTGLDARALVGDSGLVPVAGQMVVVENPGIDRFFQDLAEGEDLTYVIPHRDYVLLGGNAVAGSADLTVNPDVSAGILKRCATIDPRLPGARVLGHRVGLRPGRPTVRLEREDADGYPVVHNYGHGGSGITLSWGCAREVLSLI